MKTFALKHPWLFSLLVVPAAAAGVVRLTYALMGKKTPGEQALENIVKRHADDGAMAPAPVSAAKKA